MEICIADTWIGIRHDDLRKIFEKFMQIDFALVRQYEGTGLGLWVSYGIVRSFRGDITVHSERGKGTSFCVTLPLNPKEYRHG